MNSTQTQQLLDLCSLFPDITQKLPNLKTLNKHKAHSYELLFPANSFPIFNNLSNKNGRHYLLYKVCTDSDHVHTVHYTAIMCILYTAQRSCAYCTLHSERYTRQGTIFCTRSVLTAIMCILYTAQRSCAYCTLHSDHVHTVHCAAIMCILYTAQQSCAY